MMHFLYELCLCSLYILLLSTTLLMLTGKPVPAKKSKKGAAARAAEPEPGQALISAGQAPPQSAAAAESMLAWEGLGLGPRVIAAIATLGFDEPTPIQRECMQPAIRDRRDIIGAAQTVASPNTVSIKPIRQNSRESQGTGAAVYCLRQAIFSSAAQAFEFDGSSDI